MFDVKGICRAIPGLDSLLDQMKSTSPKGMELKAVLREKFTSIFYTASSATTSIAQLLSSVVIIKFVDPSELGVWNSVKLLTAYSFVILFGINNGLNRELPYTLGQNNAELARKRAGVALYYNVLASVFLVAAGLGAILLLANRVEYNLLLALAVILPYITINHYNNYLTVTYRSKDSFNVLSCIKFAESILMLATVLLVVQFGYGGMLVRSLAVLLVITLVMHIYRPIRVRPEWDKTECVTLLKTGIPIFAIDYIKNICDTLAPIFVLKYGGFGMVGLFSLGSMAFACITVIPSSITQYTYPKYSFAFGRHGNPKDLWRIGMRSMLLCFAMLVPTVLLSLICIAPLVQKYFPNYSGGIPAARIFILAALFNSASVLTAILLSLKHFKVLLFNQMLFSALLVLLPGLCVSRFSDPSVGASLGVLIANAVNFFVVLVTVYSSTHRWKQRNA
jgi:O-antigen/teichoic acid export membrane protein